jgi:hypothetical protein
MPELPTLPIFGPALRQIQLSANRPVQRA